jgi:hypothetical protein
LSCTGPLARGWSGRTSNLINTETRDKTTCDGCSCQVWLRSVAHAQAKPASLDRRASTCSRLAVRYECSARERWKDCQLWHTGRISQPSFGTHPLLQQRMGTCPPVSASATAMVHPRTGAPLKTVTYASGEECATPRALRLDETGT